MQCLFRSAICRREFILTRSLRLDMKSCCCRRGTAVARQALYVGLQKLYLIFLYPWSDLHKKNRVETYLHQRPHIEMRMRSCQIIYMDDATRARPDSTAATLAGGMI